MGVRFKRLLAFAIDWNITFCPFVFIISFLSTFLQKESAANPFIALFCFFAIIFAFAAFVLRDVIFRGRSLGKRILGLFVYEKSTLKQASFKQCFLRNVFFFLYFIDGIFLLVTGLTIGDRAAGTLVTSRQGIEAYADEIHKSCPTPKKKKVKITVLVMAIIIACLTLFTGLIQIVLHTQKDTEEYKVAYGYFVESQAFKALNADESKIRFHQYSSHMYTSDDNLSVSQTVKIRFLVNFKSFEVVCHKENDMWQVCDACTLFK